MEMRFYDCAEDIELAIKTMLISKFQTNVTSVFTSYSAQDTAEFGEAMPVPDFLDANIKLGNIETMLLGQDSFPCVLIDCADEDFLRKGSHSVMSGKNYAVEIVICVTHDDITYLDRINKRTAKAMIKTILENCYLSGKCNGMAYRHISYSHPLMGVDSKGWFRATLHQLEVAGITD
jgi:hypothetical protein